MLVANRVELVPGRGVHLQAEAPAPLLAFPKRDDLERPAGGVPAAPGGAGDPARLPARRAGGGKARHQPEDLG